MATSRAHWVPNSFVIACLLTLVTFALVIIVAGKNPIAAEGYWTKGFWELLELTTFTAFNLGLTAIVLFVVNFVVVSAAFMLMPYVL